MHFGTVCILSYLLLMFITGSSQNETEAEYRVLLGLMDRQDNNARAKRARKLPRSIGDQLYETVPVAMRFLCRATRRYSNL
jgi:hypothetical protein